MMHDKLLLNSKLQLPKSRIKEKPVKRLQVSEGLETRSHRYWLSATTRILQLCNSQLFLNNGEDQ